MSDRIPFRKANPHTFYSRLAKNLLNDSVVLQAYLHEHYPEGQALMNRHFRQYWEEFARWWKPMEDADWFNFVQRPHNSWMFIQFIFFYYPDVRKAVLAELAQTPDATEGVSE